MDIIGGTGHLVHNSKQSMITDVKLNNTVLATHLTPELTKHLPILLSHEGCSLHSLPSSSSEN